MTLPSSGCIHVIDLILVSILTFPMSRISENQRIIDLTLMFDLENEGQTHLCMTFRISGCKHHTDMKFVTILTFSRPGISKMLN